MNRISDRRLRLLVALSVLGFGLVVGRAIKIQAVDAHQLMSEAQAQQQATEPIPVSRGAIFDRNGKLVAQQTVAERLMVHPKQIEDPAATAAYIAQKLGFTRKKVLRKKIEELVPKLTPTGLTDATVLRQLDPAVVDDILSEHPPGLFAEQEPARSYPFGRLAPQLLGYTDVDLNGQKGAGLEYSLNRYLAGRPGEKLEVRAPSGEPMEMLTLRQARPGRDVHLTIDQAIQARVQTVLEATAHRWKAKSATAIVLDPKTGEILAMGSAPGYNNNDVHDLTAKQVAEWTRNRAVQDTYEPGSTFKVVTFAAALSAGIIYPQMKFSHIPYEIQVADKRIHDDMARGPITLTASQILQQSSNVGTVTIAQMVGKDTLYDWIRRFGFGHETPLHLYGEGSGLVMKPEDWYGSSIGNIPIGQGISVTPIQMASMYAAIANGGVLVEPHVVSQIEGQQPFRPTRKRIVEPLVDHQLVNMLKGVVDTAAGTGVRAKISGYTVAGKTGTAQKAENGGYSKTDYVASFVGFFPADDPQVEVMVVVDSPRGNIFGGLVAAPAFQEIGTFLTQALSIRPDQPVRPAG